MNSRRAIDYYEIRREIDYLHFRLDRMQASWWYRLGRYLGFIR